MDEFIRIDIEDESTATVEILDKCTSHNNFPSLKWGHAATAFNGCMYVYSGRDDKDLVEFHRYDPHVNAWDDVYFRFSPGSFHPHPRRRMSCGVIGNAFMTFGGYDQIFYNDLYIVNLKDFIQPDLSSSLFTHFSHFLNTKSPHQEWLDPSLNFTLRVNSLECEKDIDLNAAFMLYRAGQDLQQAIVNVSYWVWVTLNLEIQNQPILKD